MAKSYNDRQWELVYKLHCYGYTYKELGEWLRLAPGTVKHNVWELGHETFERVPLSKFDEQLRRLGDARTSV